MFASINIAQGGFFVSRASLIGFTEAEIAVVNENRAAPERVQQVTAALQVALDKLLYQPAAGRPC